ncbi:hypothetical protein TRFO_15121 [Tritrichomonas foetus]|uniref:USP domain-containing protein n=1 Tax=Tritrichomonas foetus TaxID=1144522 RepID=A0A1J4KXN5_9EUKA|nr:hypothetical protein TRFO_15121 [Tritrichomonas foetus]|eukprot:OHT14470.1 hypothetical protein TRFO_15121 [Tritrichomonas foetus]
MANSVMTIHPSDGFDDWRSFFIGSLEESGNYKSFLYDSILIINQIAENNFILPPNHLFTESFVNDTIPQIIEKIMNFKTLPKSELDLVVNFIKTATVLIPWAAINDKIKIFPNLISLLDRNMPFYKSLNKGKDSPQLNSIYQYFIDHEFLTLIALRISSHTNNPIQFDHIFLFFSLLDKFSKISETTLFNLLIIVIPIFVKMLESFNVDSNITHLQCQQILDTLQIFIHLIENIFDENAISILSSYLILGFSFLETTNLDKQLLGASIYKIISESKNRTVKDNFLNFMKEKNFISVLVEKDLHSDVLNKLIPIFKYLATSRKISEDEAIKIFNSSTTVHLEQKEIYIQLIYDIIKYFDDSKLKIFIDKIIEDNYSTIDFINFLSVFLLKHTPNDQITAFIIEQIIENSVKLDLKDQQIIIPIVQDLCDSKSPDLIKKTLFEICKEKFMKEFSPLTIAILTQLSSISTSLNQYDDSFYEAITEHLNKEALMNSSILELFSNFIANSKHSINIKIMTSILSILNNENNTGINHENSQKNNTNITFWHFLIKVIKSNGINIFEDKALNVLKEFIINSKQANDSFLKLLKKLIKILNFQNGQLVKDEKGIFTVKKLPLEFENKLFEIIIFGQSGVSKGARKFLIKLFNNPESFPLVIPHLLEIMDKIDSHKDQELRRYLHVIESLYKNQLSKDNFHIFPHSMTFSEADSFNSILYFDVSIHEIEQLINFRVTMKNSICTAFLIYELTPHLLHPLSFYDLKVGDKDLFSIQQIDKKFFSSNKIIVSRKVDNSFYESTDMRDILVRKGFVNKLLNYFSTDQEEKTSKIIWRMVENLPNDLAILSLTLHPEEFFKKLTNINNTHTMKYYLQVLLWRFHASEMVKKYENNKKGNPLFTDLLVKNPKIFALSVSEVLKIINILNIDTKDITPPLLSFYPMSEVESKEKFNIAKYIVSTKSDLSGILGENIKLFFDALDFMTENIFLMFKPLILKIDDFFPVYNQVTANINSGRMTDTTKPYYISILLHYFQQVNKDKQSVRDNVKLCINLLHKIKSQDIIETIKSLINDNPDQFNDAEDIINELLIFIRSGFPENFKNHIYLICSDLSKISKSNKHTISDYIDFVNSIKFDKWNFAPDQPKKTIYTGLKNLGATCYMNSVLQQFYHIPLFRHILLEHSNIKLNNTTSSYNESFFQMQLLFARLKLSKKPWCDPKQFFDKWTQSHTHYLPIEQQDAHEFMQFLVDDLPESLKMLYTGTLTNFIEGIGEFNSIKSQIDESFISLPILIEKYSTIEESLKSIIKPQKLFGNNKYTTEDGTKINAESHQKLRSVPPILILQLTRFKYNQNTQSREKINTRFEISNEIDISDIVYTHKGNQDEVKKQYQYKLHGAVIHKGDGNFGHYISYIRLQEKWFKFNDMEISEASQSQFEEESFGSNTSKTGSELNDMNGYILFYIVDNKNLNESDSNKVLFGSYDDIIPTKIVDEISQENDKYLIEQSIFSSSTYDLIFREASSSQLRDFIFNILPHSQEKGTTIFRFKEHALKEIIDETLIDWLNTNFETIIQIFVNCGKPEIVKLILNIVNKAIELADIEKGREFVSKFMYHLPNCLTSWRQVYEVSTVILNYIKENKDSLEYCKQNNWDKILTDFVMATYNGERQEYFLQNINISPIFEALNLLITHENKGIYSQLLEIHQQVSKSPSNQIYKNLLTNCVIHNLIYLEEFLKIYPNELAQAKIIELQLDKLSNSNFMEIIHSFNSFKISPKEVLSFMYENQSKYKQYLLDNMQYFSQISTLEVNLSEKLFYEITENLDDKQLNRILHDLIGNIKEISNEESRIILSLLRILFYLMEKTHYPCSEKITELYSLDKKYHNSIEMMKILSYWNDPIFLTYFDNIFCQEEQRKDKNEVKNSKKKYEDKEREKNASIAISFFEIIPVIITLPDDLFYELINKPKFPIIIQIAVESCAEKDHIEKMKKFLDFIVQSKYLSQQDKEEPNILHKILFIIVTGNNKSNSYLLQIARYFPFLSFEIDFNEIVKSIEIINLFMKSDPNMEINDALSFYVPSVLEYFINKFDHKEKKYADKINSLDLCFDRVCNHICKCKDVNINRTLSNLVLKICSINNSYLKKVENECTSSLSKKSPKSYIYATFLSSLSFASEKNLKKIDEDLLKIYKYIKIEKNETGRDFLFMSYIENIHKFNANIPQEMKTFSINLFPLAALSSSSEKNFFDQIFHQFSEKEATSFVFELSKKFTLNDLNVARITDENIKQLIQLEYLVTVFPHIQKEIADLFSIKREWMKNDKIGKYVTKILPKF